MLEITLLKVRHYTVQDARKILPYIKKCDVFSVESAYTTEQAAQLKEQLWEDIQSMSMTEFRQSMLESARMQQVETGISDYVLKVQEYVFGEKIPLWYAERFSEEKSAVFLDIEQELHLLRTEALNKLIHGNVTEFIHDYKENSKKQMENARMRDVHIAEQLDQAETNIRERYSQLAAKEPLKYTLYLGSSHSPEKYANVPVNVVRLIDESDVIAKVTREIGDGNFYEDLDKDLLAIGLISLRSSQHLRGLVTLTEDQITAMSLEEMSDYIGNRVSASWR